MNRQGRRLCASICILKGLIKGCSMKIDFGWCKVFLWALWKCMKKMSLKKWIYGISRLNPTTWGWVHEIPYFVTLFISSVKSLLICSFSQVLIFVVSCHTLSYYNFLWYADGKWVWLDQSNFILPPLETRNLNHRQ